MPIYEYEATTAEGQRKSGTIQASSRMLATVKLRQEGLHLHVLTEARTSPATAGPPAAGKAHYSPWYPLRAVPLSALADFYSQLGQLLRAGVHPHDAADALQGRVHPRLRKVLAELIPALAAGEGIAENLAKYHQIFPPDVQAMLRVGESSGNLDKMCQVLASQYDEELRLHRMLLLPKIYYGIVLLFAILIPTFPWIISRGFSWYVHQLLTVLIPVILGIIVLILLGKVLVALPVAKSLTDDVIYRLPLLAPLGWRAAQARLLTSLHVLMQAGIDLPTALDLAAPTTGLRPMQAELRVAAEQVRQEIPVAQALQKCRALSDQAKGALGTAQQSGLYEQALERLAERALEQREAIIKRIATVGTIGSLLIAGIITAIAVGIGWLSYFNALFDAGEKLMP